MAFKRNSLSEAELKQLPENPAESIELAQEDLENVLGGVHTGGSACHTTGCNPSQPTAFF